MGPPNSNWTRPRVAALRLVLPPASPSVEPQVEGDQGSTHHARPQRPDGNFGTQPQGRVEPSSGDTGPSERHRWASQGLEGGERSVSSSGHGNVSRPRTNVSRDRYNTEDLDTHLGIATRERQEAAATQQVLLQQNAAILQILSSLTRFRLQEQGSTKTQGTIPEEWDGALAGHHVGGTPKGTQQSASGTDTSPLRISGSKDGDGNPDKGLVSPGSSEGGPGPYNQTTGLGGGAPGASSSSGHGMESHAPTLPLNEESGDGFESPGGESPPGPRTPQTRIPGAGVGPINPEARQESPSPTLSQAAKYFGGVPLRPRLDVAKDRYSTEELARQIARATKERTESGKAQQALLQQNAEMLKALTETRDRVKELEQSSHRPKGQNGILGHLEDSLFLRLPLSLGWSRRLPYVEKWNESFSKKCSQSKWQPQQSLVELLLRHPTRLQLRLQSEPQQRLY